MSSDMKLLKRRKAGRIKSKNRRMEELKEKREES
jgi:hypothetical protein